MTKQEYMAFSLYKGLKVDIRYNNGCADTKCIVLQGYDLDQEYKVTPYCRPLSDLTKEIEHIKLDLNLNIESENYNYLGIINYSHAFFLDGFQVGIMAMPFFFIQKLIELHFDIARLIDKGEAIDVNTLETNPYK